MTIPVSVDSSEYYEHLRGFRDSALDASNWYGRRKNIGDLEYGAATAGWQAQDGGVVDLKHAGLRFRGLNITRLMPTTLRIINPDFNGNHDITTFSMDLDEIGWVDVYRNTYTNGGLAEVAFAGISRLIDQKNGLQHPTKFDRELLFTELQRGASGDFAIY